MSAAIMTFRLNTGLELSIGMQMPFPDVPPSANTDRLDEKEPSEQAMSALDSPANSRTAMQQLIPFWSVADLQQAQLEDSTIGLMSRWLKCSQDRPPKSDIASYSDATKLYWAQWASLRL